MLKALDLHADTRQKISAVFNVHLAEIGYSALNGDHTILGGTPESKGNVDENKN